MSNLEVSNKHKVCPRCENILTSDSRCNKCGWPKLLQKADACRHVKLRVGYDLKIKCLDPQCRATFVLHPKKEHHTKIKANNILIRCPDDPSFRLNAREGFDAQDPWVFWAIREDLLNHWSYQSTPLWLENTNEVEQPPEGWGWVSIPEHSKNDLRKLVKSACYDNQGVYDNPVFTSALSQKTIEQLEKQIKNFSMGYHVGDGNYCNICGMTFCEHLGNAWMAKGSMSGRFPSKPSMQSIEKSIKSESQPPDLSPCSSSSDGKHLGSPGGTCQHCGVHHPNKAVD